MPKLVALWIWESCDTTSLATKGKGQSRRRRRSSAYSVASSTHEDSAPDSRAASVTSEAIGDELDADTHGGQSFSHAQKMRATISWYYGYQKERGMSEWKEGKNGKCTGNPSYSTTVSTLMKGIKRQKVCSLTFLEGIVNNV